MNKKEINLLVARKMQSKISKNYFKSITAPKIEMNYILNFKTVI